MQHGRALCLNAYGLACCKQSWGQWEGEFGNLPAFSAATAPDSAITCFGVVAPRLGSLTLMRNITGLATEHCLASQHAC